MERFIGINKKLYNLDDISSLSCNSQECNLKSRSGDVERVPRSHMSEYQRVYKDLCIQTGYDNYYYDKPETSGS